MPIRSASEGLTSAEAARRLLASGPNEIRRTPPPPWWRMLASQFANALILVLLAACALSLALGEVADAVAIAAIVVVNACVGFVQEFRAERSLLALRRLTSPRARVVRDGHAVVLPSADVVPGDVLVLEGGDVVAADARLLEAHDLTTSEAALTGESLPVEKRAQVVAPGAALAERRDHVFAGTHVSTGTGRAEVVATGMGTELGKIAHLLATAEAGATPLQERLGRVARAILWLCLAIVLVVAISGALRGEPWLGLLLTSISLAVAAVPEGLPAVVTIALALGVQRLARRHVLVRKLPAVETLGSVTVICTDKTGTLTTGTMAVRELRGLDEQRLLEVAAACCDAELLANGTGTGDPTELAILEAARARGILREAIERENPRVSVRPFDAARRRMSVLRADGVNYVKGAAEVVLPLCGASAGDAAEETARLASRGLRVLAVATGRGSEERSLTFTGLVGLADPPRPEAISAIAAARGAGVRTVMITGDHPATAREIARELGLVQTGEDPAPFVHARATAEDKLRIVRELKQQGGIVAMTGDGVNDAPALREAHIGIAMGLAGTEVTREASDIVLTDDNYASIVAGVAEGRAIFERIRRTLMYLLTGNSGELIAVLVASLAGWPVPFVPLQLLWINLVTETLPALALVSDRSDEDPLAHPPRQVTQPILGRREWAFILRTGLLEAAVTLGAFHWALRDRGLLAARGIAFTVFVISALFRSFAARSERRLLFEIGAFSNLRLFAVVAACATGQLLLHHLAPARRLFDVDVLSLRDVARVVAVGLVPVSAIELGKLLRRLGRARS